MCRFLLITPPVQNRCGLSFLVATLLWSANACCRWRRSRDDETDNCGFSKSLETGVTDITGFTLATGVWMGVSDLGRFGEVERDFDSSDIGDTDRLRQFFNHSSGVISGSLDVLPFSFRYGFISKCAWVSLQKICILYWFKHLSEQNWSCDAPSWKST